MLKMIKGVSVPFPEKLSEAYEIHDNYITANIGTDKILNMFKHFLLEHEKEPVFFILEIPCNANEEEANDKGMVETTHRNVYYIDGLTSREALKIIEIKGELLLNDGLSSFGFGGHESQDELMKNDYNICTLFSRNLVKYREFFKTLKIEETKKLITAWDTFDYEHPGVCMSYRTDDEDIYDMVDYFKDWGIYLAERREG